MCGRSAACTWTPSIKTLRFKVAPDDINVGRSQGFLRETTHAGEHVFTHGFAATCTKETRARLRMADAIVAMEKQRRPTSQWHVAPRNGAKPNLAPALVPLLASARCFHRIYCRSISPAKQKFCPLAHLVPNARWLLQLLCIACGLTFRFMCPMLSWPRQHQDSERNPM